MGRKKAVVPADLVSLGVKVPRALKVEVQELARREDRPLQRVVRRILADAVKSKVGA